MSQAIDKKRRLTIAALGLSVISWPASAQRTMRIISIGGAMTEIVYALGAQSRLIARDTTSTYPDAANQLPHIGYQRNLAAEGIAALKPDLVLAGAEAGPPTVIKQLRELGIRIEQISHPPGTEYSMAEVRKKIQLVGQSLGLASLGNELQQRFDLAWQQQTQQQVQRIAQWQMTRQDKPAHRPAMLFILSHTGNQAMVAGAQTAADAVMRYAGAEPALGKQFNGYKPLTAEAAVTAAPELILTTQEGLQQMGGIDRLLEQPGLALTPAGKQRRVIAMDSLYLLGFGPRLPQAINELNAHIYGKPAHVA
ncbi:heme/hemin ABC transporter substrate-binding protein [Ampullimonas aquatilis]|uniref:heme/hemin ABC transporter substrate-binding protein n=1 Tax=Ampullimonas aquatilis TaxID=1341549 RepID=UPI003C7594AF